MKKPSMGLGGHKAKIKTGKQGFPEGNVKTSNLLPVCGQYLLKKDPSK
jgi:hypothetical protein